MRNTIGHYIDLLSPAARDYILMMPVDRWCTMRPADAYGRRCLVGHAAVVGDDIGNMRNPEFLDAATRGLRKGRRYTPAMRFDALVGRVGMEKALRLIKARAGAMSTRDVPEPAEVR